LSFAEAPQGVADKKNLLFKSQILGNARGAQAARRVKRHGCPFLVRFLDKQKMNNIIKSSLDRLNLSGSTAKGGGFHNK